MAQGASMTAKNLASSSGRQEEEIDVKKLSQAKIRQMMGSDPKFITRLIGQLDKQMHNMMREKTKRQAQIDADMKELADIEGIISSHVRPNLERLNESIRLKTELRDNLKKQLQTQKANLQSMQKEAAALIQSTRAITGKLMRATASQRLEESRGFSSTVPTTTLLRGGTTRKPGASGSATSSPSNTGRIS